MNLVFDPPAAQEYAEAVECYETQESGLGERLRADLWAAISILERFPLIGREVRPDTRMIMLRRFLFKLIYSARDAGLYIIALAYNHREPDYWAGRT